MLIGAVAGFIVLVSLILPRRTDHRERRHRRNTLRRGRDLRSADHDAETHRGVPSRAPTPLPAMSRPPTGIDVATCRRFLTPDTTGRDRPPLGLSQAPRLGQLLGAVVPGLSEEMPRLEGFWLQHKEAGLVILGVGVRDDASTMRSRQ